MGIISLKEKRTDANTTKTTGRERSYFVSDQFPSTFAKITGKIFSYGNSSSSVYGGFGAFWENTDGTLVNLEMEIGNLGSFYERGSRINTSATGAWYDLEINLNLASDGRLVFYGRKTGNNNHFQSDVDLDDIKLVSSNGVIVDFDPSTTAVRTGTKWQRSATGEYEAVSITSYSTAKSAYPNANWTNMGNSWSSGGDFMSWNFTTEDGGGSNGTGSDNAADNNDNTVYLYWEATSNTVGYNKGSFLRWKNNYSLTTGAEL